MGQPTKENSHAAKRAAKVRQFSSEFDRLIRKSQSVTRSESSSPRTRSSSGWSPARLEQICFEYIPMLLGGLLGLGVMALPLALLGYLIWAKQFTLLWILLVLLGLVCPGICKAYGVIVGGFTVWTGVKLAVVAGQSFLVLPAFPFVIAHPQISYFYLGWGLLAASRKSRSKLGFSLALLNLLGGALGLFSFKTSTVITLPGQGGAIVSGLLTVGLGSSIISTILQSYQPDSQKPDSSKPGPRA